MKIVFPILIVALICMSTTCKREGSRCHKHIYFKNQSSAPVIVAYRYTHLVNQCLLEGDTLASNDTRDLALSYCIEDELRDGTKFELYVIDTSLYNSHEFYSCDSIGIKNKILRHYALSAKELKEADYQIYFN